jgi:hypothetical protein
VGRRSGLAWLPAALPVVACLHTAPHDPFPGEVTRTVERRDVITHTGEQCIWEAEQLRFGGADLWTHEPPEGEGWCGGGWDKAWLSELRGRDGPYVSAVLSSMDSTAGPASTWCTTWDLRTRGPTTLAAYDARHAERRLELLDRARERDPSLAGWTIAPDAFLIADRHVRFCAARGTTLRLVPVR